MTALRECREEVGGEGLAAAPEHAEFRVQHQNVHGRA